MHDEFLRPYNTGFELKSEIGGYYWDNRNRLPEACIVQYTVSGSGCFECDGRRVELPPGTGFVTWIPSDSKYFLPERAEAWEFLFFKCTGTLAREFCAGYVERNGHLFSLTSGSTGERLLYDIYKCGVQGDTPSMLKANSSIYSFFNVLVENAMAGSEPTPQALMQQAASYLDNRLHHTGLNVDEVAEHVGMSKAHFSRAFRKAQGITPYEYLIQRRIEYARELLVSTRLSVKQVAELCGFSHYPNFCNTFRKRLGMSPGQFRLEVRGTIAGQWADRG